MIGYLKGKIKIIIKGGVILEINGVGYKIETTKLDKLENSEAEYYIYTHVREQELRLFGFESIKELELFERLISVSGVGPKVAMQLLSSIGIEQILEAIQTQNWNILKAPGVGNKTAQKIVLELNGKLEDFGKIQNYKHQDIILDAKTALENLGYKENELNDELQNINISDDWTSEDLIKVLLKQLKKV